MKKRGFILGLALLAGLMTGCGSASRGNSSASASTLQYSESSEKITLNLAAAASLKNVFDDEIIPMFEEEHKNIDVNFRHRLKMALRQTYSSLRQKSK